MRKKRQNKVKKVLFNVPFIAFIVFGTLIFLYVGSRNRIDKTWLMLDSVLVANNVIVDKYSPQGDTLEILDYYDALNEYNCSKYKIINTEQRKCGFAQLYYYYHKGEKDIEPFVEWFNRPFYPTWPTEKIHLIIDSLLHIADKEIIRKKLKEDSIFYHSKRQTFSKIINKQQEDTLIDNDKFGKLSKFDSLLNKMQKKSMEHLSGKDSLAYHSKRKKLLNKLSKLTRKRIVINGVTGSGKTTFVTNFAKFVTGRDDRIFRLQFVQRMEVEYHKRWVGYYDTDGFHPGKLLRIFEQCNNAPNHNYVLILDDIDKIPPATFFGSDIWTELNNSKETVFIEGYDKEINIPDNLFIISVIHEGASSVQELSDEHLRRLSGDQRTKIDIMPDYKELFLYLQGKYLDKEISATQIKRMLYLFIKINNYIKDDKNYGPGLTLGQWSTIRKLRSPEQIPEFVDAFVEHINSFKPKVKLHKRDLERFVVATKNHGYLPNSSLLNDLYIALDKTGIFAELVVALSFALASAIAGWIFILRKRKLITKLQTDLYDTVDKFGSGNFEYEEATERILDTKSQIEELIAEKRIKHDEAVYLLLFIEDHLKKIEELKKVHSTTDKFRESFKEFTKDGMVDENEYKILKSFLENIKDNLPTQVFYQLKNELDRIYAQSKKK